MEEASKFKIIIDGHLTKIPCGVKVIKWNDTCFLLIWHGQYIEIIEKSMFMDKETYNPSVEVDVTQHQSNEIKLKGDIVDVFMVGGGSVFALDSLGFLYSLSHVEDKPSSPALSMEVDLFSSSPTNASSKWKENEVTRVINCEAVLSVCQLTSGLAILTFEDECLAIQIYSFPELTFKSIVHFEKCSNQGAVLSSCNISLLSPSLKKMFREKLEVLDTEIVIVGFPSGMVLWCCVTSSSLIKGPFFLCSLLHKVQNMYWMNDPTSNLITNLLIVLSSGPVVIFGSQTETDNKPTTLYLPDCVKTSLASGNCVLSSNFIDCFISELKFGEKITMSSSSLPIKGITAMANVPDSGDLIVSTVHSVYIIEPHGMTFDNSSPQFIIPEQSLLDNLLIQTQLLDDIYKQMHDEDKVLKAISTSIVAQNFPHLFKTTLKVTSDSEFSIIISLTEADISFSRELWNVYTETCYMDGTKQNRSMKLKEDLNSERDLAFTVSEELRIDSIVVVELVSFLDNEQPVIIVPVGKVKVDASYLMVSNIFTPAVPKDELTLGKILSSWKSEPSVEKDHECRLIFCIPDVIPLTSCLKLILKDSQGRIVADDWNKITEFKKHNAHIMIKHIPIMLHLNLESKELVIASSDAEICHKVKEAVTNRLINQNGKNRCISEDLALTIQGMYQSLEVEILREVQEFEVFQQIKNKIRSTISSKVDSL